MDLKSFFSSWKRQPKTPTAASSASPDHDAPACMDKFQAILNRSATFLDKVSRVNEVLLTDTHRSRISRVSSQLTSALKQAQDITRHLRTELPSGDKSSLDTIYDSLSEVERMIKETNFKMDGNNYLREGELNKVLEEDAILNKFIEERGSLDDPRSNKEILESSEYKAFRENNPPKKEQELWFFPESCVLREGSQYLDARNPHPLYKFEHVIDKLGIVPKSIQSKLDPSVTNDDTDLEDFEEWQSEFRKDSCGGTSWFDR